LWCAKENIFSRWMTRSEDFCFKIAARAFRRQARRRSSPSVWQGEAKMSFNLFDWIRESVKRSVIQGVSEALEVIGADDDARSRLAQLSAASAGPAMSLGSEVKRKRLGRSLRDADGNA
jgi:hypothetical protein